jgi:hypothetical protein
VPGPWLDQSVTLQVAVGLQHGVGVHGRRRDKFPHRRELVTHLQHAHPERLTDLLHDLQVRRRHRTVIDPEADDILKY